MKKVLAVLLAFVALLLIIVLSGLPIPVDFLRARVESVAGRILEREVTIDGPMRVRFSLHPELEISGVRIADPQGWPAREAFVEVGDARLKVSVVPLFSHKLDIDSVHVEAVKVRLVSRADRTDNYSLFEAAEEGDSDWTFDALDAVDLRDIAIRYVDELTDTDYAFSVDRAEGQGPNAAPMRLKAEGAVAGQPYTLELNGGTLRELLAGTAPWSLTQGKLLVADLALDVSGTVGSASDGRTGYFDLSIQGESLDALAGVFDTALPETGAFSLSGRLGVLPGLIKFTGLRLAALNAELTGDLALSLHDPRPAVAGVLSIQELDVRRLPALAGGTAGGEPPDARAASGDALPWELLRLVDADLNLRAGSVVFDREPFVIRTVHAAVSLVDGDLVAPFSFTALEAPATGQIEILTATGTPSVDVGLSTGPVALDALFADAAGPPQLTGKLGPVLLRASTTGRSIDQMWNGLGLDLKLGESRLESGSTPVLALESASLARNTGQPFSLSAVGGLLNRPLGVQARVGGSKTSGDPEGSVLSLSIKACDADLHVNVGVRNEPGGTAAKIDFEAAGRHLCGLLQSVENFLGGAADFSVLGRGELRAGSASLDLETVQLGELRADAAFVLDRNEQGKPHLAAKVHSRHLDLRALFEDAEESSFQAPTVSDDTQTGGDDQARAALAQRIGQALSMLDKEIVPHDIRFGDAVDIDFHVERLTVGTGSLTEIRLSAGVAEGKLKQAPFSLTIGDHLFTGDTRLDLTGDVPAIGLEVSSREVDFPRLLSAFDVAGVPELTAEKIAVTFALEGTTIKQLINEGSHELTVEGGRLRVPRALSEPLQVDLTTAVLKSDPHEPTVLSLTGLIDGVPVSLEAKGQGLIDRKKDSPLTLSVRADLAGTVLSVDSQVLKQDEVSVLRFNSSLSGDRLDALNALLGFHLPPLGPYLIQGAMQVGENEIALHDLGVKTGESELDGELVIASTLKQDGTYGPPLVVRAKLNADIIQLNDFRLSEWSPAPPDEDAGVAPGSAEEAETKQEATAELAGSENPEAGARLNSLLSPEVAKLIEASITVDIRDVRSGPDSLGRGRLHAVLEDGLYALDEFRVEIPGGEILIGGSLEPSATSMAARFAISVDNLDYGVLARRAQPDTNFKGVFNLNIDLRAQAEDLSRLKEHASGHVRLAMEPEELSAGIVDLWAVNIVAAVLPVIMKGEESKINCLVGDLTLDDGVMRPEALLLDTSKIRVAGKGEVNFKTNTVDMHFKPKPKSPQFLSLATPVSVTGPLTDFHVGVSASGVIGTVFRVVSGVVTVPVQKLFSKKMEADGSEACAAAMAWVHGR